MKAGRFFMTVCLVFCFGFGVMLAGCDSDGGEARLGSDKKIMGTETQQVACDTVEVVRQKQFYPVSSRSGKAISLEKISPKGIKVNSPFNYNFRVTNLTDKPVTNVIVRDKVSGDMTFVESSMTMERISDEQVQWKVGTLEPKASAMINSKAVVTGVGTITSCAEVFYECPVCAEIMILNSNLSLSMSAPEEVMACDRIELKYQVSNSGTASACDIVIKEKLPEGLLTAEGKDSFEFKIDTLAPGEIREFSKMVDPIKTGKFTGKAVLSALSVDSLESNEVEINVIEPVLTLKESKPQPEAMEYGSIFEYVLTNKGNAVAQNAMIVAMLPDGAMLSNASDDGKILESDPRIVAWTIGDLKPNMTKTVTMVIDGDNEITPNPQAVAKANCAHTVAATRLEELNELISVSLYKPLVPE